MGDQVKQGQSVIDLLNSMSLKTHHVNTDLTGEDEKIVNSMQSKVDALTDKVSGGLMQNVLPKGLLKDITGEKDNSVIEEDEELFNSKLETISHLIVYPEANTGVDTDSEMHIENNLFTKSGGFYLITSEYPRAIRSVNMIAKNMFEDKFQMFQWDSVHGMQGLDELIGVDDEEDNSKIKQSEADKLYEILKKVLKYLQTYKGDKKYAFVIRDLSFFVTGLTAKGKVIQIVNEIFEEIKETGHQLIITDMYEKNVPDSIAHVDRIKFDMPNEADLNRLMCEIYPALSEYQQKQLTKKNIIRIIDMLLGIEYEDARRKILSLFHRYNNLDSEFFMELSAFKKEEINKNPALEYYEAQTGFSWAHYIGRDHFKDEVKEMKVQMDNPEKFEKFKTSKFILLAGQPGTGKSYGALCLASYFGKPIVRVDLRNLLGPLQGDAESRFEDLRKLFFALKDHVVFWFDEFEKMFAAGDKNVQKSSVESGLEGKVLTMMQELKYYGTIIVATANECRKLSPAQIRAQRVDFKFYFGAPNDKERREFIQFYNKKFKGPEIDDNKLNHLVSETDGFVESELEAFIEKTIKDYRTIEVMLELGVEGLIKSFDYLEIVHDVLSKIHESGRYNQFISEFDSIHKKELYMHVSELTDEYNIEFDMYKFAKLDTFNNEIFFAIVYALKDIIKDGAWTKLQNHHIFSYLTKSINENKNLKELNGNIGDEMKELLKEHKVDGVLKDIIKELLEQLLNLTDGFDSIRQLQAKKFVLDNDSNRKNLLLLIASVATTKVIKKDKDNGKANVNQTKNNSKKAKKTYQYVELDKTIFNKLKNIYDVRGQFTLKELLEKLNEIKYTTQDAVIKNLVKLYKKRVHFPELKASAYLEMAEVYKDSIIKVTREKEWEDIEEWGHKNCEDASGSKKIKQDQHRIHVAENYFGD